MHPLIALLKIVPKNFCSWVVGFLVRLQFPDTFQNFLNRKFVEIFKINMSEAARPIEDYGSIEDVFTRTLKDGERPIASAFCSPCDGTLTFSKALEDNHAIQAKGINYNASELVFAKDCSTEQSRLSAFTTIYLAPHNYHRVHSPVEGTVSDIRYIPGELWPVNNLSVSRVPGVFTRNERLVFHIQTKDGGFCHLAMVGAFNVGRISSPLLDGFVSNARALSKGRFQHFQLPTPFAIKAGDELGTFMLGSTVVMVMDDKFLNNFQILNTSDPRSIKLGETLLK